METIKINNTILKFNKIIYVNAINGNDTSGNGSKSAPYKTLQKALSSININNTAIYLYNGIYEIDSMHDLFYSRGFSNISYLGNQSIVMVNNRAVTNTVDIKYTTFYQINFVVNFASISTSFWANGDNNNNLRAFRFYNCVFSDPYNKVSGVYSSYTYGFFVFDSSSSSNSVYTANWSDFINCAFDTSKAPAYYYNGSYSTNIKFQNCAIRTPALTGDSHSVTNFQSITNMFSVTFDGEKITSPGWENTGTGLNPDGTQAHIGVYGGEFAWRNWKILLKSNNKYCTYRNNEFIEVEPTVENFKEKSIYLPDLTTTTDKVILTMEGGEVLEDGKIFRKTIDVNKYKNIENIYIL